MVLRSTICCNNFPELPNQCFTYHNKNFDLDREVYDDFDFTESIIDNFYLDDLLTLFYLLSAPLQPRNLRKVKSTSTTITVAWEQPYSPYSVVNTYHLAYWKATNQLSTKTGLEVVSNSLDVEHSITDLEPNTKYNIEVHTVMLQLKSIYFIMGQTIN